MVLLSLAAPSPTLESQPVSCLLMRVQGGGGKWGVDGVRGGSAGVGNDLTCRCFPRQHKDLSAGSIMRRNANGSEVTGQE